MTEIAHLTDTQLRQVKDCEQNLGVIMVAYAKDHPIAELTDASIAKIQALEKELGVILIAYR
ncbi:hypothetical protein AZH53_00900 [Methanomicrobiaceae archaeon CYW5]|uniref:hypothetical protein n=1 Tax=Methanovulcanius yangii TaxID=1789227 RepID=UPI0029CA7E10|nr:hypothetical protein [Methanovulcanius yangii]MBT8506986.1 hypothetical protein [Methanovulcanius yangii]